MVLNEIKWLIRNEYIFLVTGNLYTSIYVNLRVVTYSRTLPIMNSQLLMAQKTGVLFKDNVKFYWKNLMKNKQFGTFAAMSDILPDVGISTRRNLLPIQKIAIAEKYRPIYERQAKVNKQKAIMKARQSNDNNKREQFSVKLPKTISLVNTAEKAEQYRFAKSGKTGIIFTNIQKIAIAEKYRPIYEKQAKKRQATSTGGANPQLVPKLAQAETNPSVNKTNTKLANLAGVGKETYRMGAKILNSNNEKLKQEVL